MVAFIDSNSVPPIPSRARPRGQGSTFATSQRPLLQRTSLESFSSHSQVLQGKSTSSPKRLHRADHSNQQYSILAISNASGAVVERVAYQAYGQPTFTNAAGTTLSSSVKATRYSYTGREWDSSLELHHFRARWMSGVSGRFLGRDPWTYKSGRCSVYESCRSNLKYNDPFGLEDEDPDKINCDRFLLLLAARTENIFPERTHPELNDEWKKGPHVFCGNCIGFENYSWPEANICHVCLTDQNLYFEEEWVSLLGHELTHCRDYDCQKGKRDPEFGRPVDVPKNSNARKDSKLCKECLNKEELAYENSCLLLYPGRGPLYKNCVALGKCYSCKPYCAGLKNYDIDCQKAKKDEKPYSRKT